MYLELLNQVNSSDPQTWAKPETWSAAVEYTSKQKLRSGSAVWILGAPCLIGALVMAVGFYFLVNKDKKN
ncbi:hypothetical protein [Nocardia yamanashiensis]|uniref:hypothetical protein n=1 Tax=Nocardia yamanashiensis TaxID=209247 RepID=UPI000A944ED6|nr:hypothetical protein [Nocardia yamanashiensis]